MQTKVCKRYANSILSRCLKISRYFGAADKNGKLVILQFLGVFGASSCVHLRLGRVNSMFKGNSPTSYKKTAKDVQFSVMNQNQSAIPITLAINIFRSKIISPNANLHMRLNSGPSRGRFPSIARSHHACNVDFVRYTSP